MASPGQVDSLRLGGSAAVGTADAGRLLFSKEVKDAGVAVEIGDENLCFSIPGGSYSPAVAAPDGTMYQVSGNGLLRALDGKGKTLWTFQAGPRLGGSPMVGRDGTVYVGCEDNRVYALNPDGSLKWRHDVGAHADTSLVQGQNGDVFVTNRAGALVAMHEEKKLFGQRKWKFGGPGCDEIATTPPAVSANGTVFAGVTQRSRGGKSSLVAFTGEGKELWRIPADELIKYGPVVGGDGRIHFVLNRRAVAQDSCMLYTVEPDGRNMHARPVPGTLHLGDALFVAPDGTIRMVTAIDDRRILSTFNADGTLKCRREFSEADGTCHSPAAMGPDGTVLIPGQDVLIAVRPDGIAWKYRTEGIVKWADADTQGRVLFENWIPGRNTYLTVIRPPSSLESIGKAAAGAAPQKSGSATEGRETIEEYDKWILVGGVKLEKNRPR